MNRTTATEPMTPNGAALTWVTTRLNSRRARTPQIAAATVNQGSGLSNQTASKTAAPRMVPEINRVLSNLKSSKSALPPGVFRQRFVYVLAREIRPKCFSKIQFSVRGLPQKEIGQSHLATGAYQKIDVRDACGVQVFSERVFVNFVWLEAARNRTQSWQQCPYCPWSDQQLL